MRSDSSITAVFSQGLVETVWGRRGLVKVNSLWFPMSIFLSSKVSNLSHMADALVLAGAVACWTTGSILVNDIADSDDDRHAGKHRWIVDLAAPVRIVVVLSIWIVGGFLAFRVGHASTLAAYGGAIVLSLLYSLEPFSLKRRGRWGLLGYSGACALAYVGMSGTFLNGSILCLAVLTSTVFLDKWVNLQFHQVIDIEADLAAHVSTYAAVVGKGQARRELIFFARLASAAMGIALACALFLVPSQKWLVGLAGAGTLIAVGTFTRIRGHASGSPLTQELPWYYLALTYSVLRATPATIFLCLAFWHPDLVPLAVVVCAFVAWETVLSFLYRRP
jgi:4-hydroxybenzoate polyprenyltransferase